MTNDFKGWCAAVRLNGGDVDRMPIVLWNRNEAGSIEGYVAVDGEPGLVPARLAGQFMGYLWSDDDNGLRRLMAKAQAEKEGK